MSAPDIAVTGLGSEQLAIDEFSDGTRNANAMATAVVAASAGLIDELPTHRERRAAERVADYRSRTAHHIRVLFAFDLLAAGLAIGSAAAVDFAGFDGIVYWVAIAIVGLIVWPTALAVSHAYRRSQLGGARAVIAGAAGVVVATALPAAWFGAVAPLRAVAIAAPVAATASLLSRARVRRQARREHRAGTAVRRVILAGTVDAVDEFQRTAARVPDANLDVVGVCVPPQEIAEAQSRNLAVVGDLDDVEPTAQQFGCHAVVALGLDNGSPTSLRRLAWNLEGTSIDLLIHPGLVDVASGRLHLASDGDLPLLTLDQPTFSGWSRRMKRALDITLTSLGLLVFWPLLAAVAIAVKLEDRGGPVFFKQTRVGIDGQPFTMYKFRSMVVDAEQRLAGLAAQNEGAGPLFKMEHDPRITRVGAFIRKYSIDELPQVFNVLAGAMSLVGPRPPLQSEVDAYEAQAYRRLKVIPGLTGLWQVSGRSLLTWEETIRLDLKYVENWTIGLDVRILFRTVSAVFASRGAF